MNRQRVSLTQDPWRFCPDPCAEGEQHGFFKSDYSARMWREVSVPSCFETACENLQFYEGVCWYRHLFSVPDEWTRRRVVLRFDAVNYRARVWLNGELLGENRDGFLPFEFDIGKTMRQKGANILAVAVDNRHYPGDVPGMHVGWRGQGGILRDVCLFATGAAWVEDARVTAEPGEHAGEMTLQLRVRDGGQEHGALAVAVTVEDENGASCGELGPAEVAPAPGDTTEVSLNSSLAGARAWSPASPARYVAQIRLLDGGETVDEGTVPFGFRRIEATPNGLLLNGEPIFLTGFNRHEDSPHTAMAVDPDTTRADLTAMKEAGANFVRLCHYPHDAAELDMCDELGLLSFAELPLYFWKDPEDGARNQAARKETAARQLERMIARDANHPSLIFWSVSNETPESRPEVAADNAALIRLARSLDPTRLCVHVSCNWLGSPHFEEDDVICVNHYPSLRARSESGTPAEADPRSAADCWRENLAALHRAYPDKPILIAEFGYCSFAGTYGHAYGEEEHGRAFEEEFAAFDAPFVCGATIWCWADHAWPAGRFLGGLTISPYGVVTRDRRKLKPFHTARRLFRTRQGLDRGSARATKPGTSVIMTRSHMRGIPEVPFPAGYGIRPMGMDDIGLWTDIQRDAETHVPVTDRLFREHFGDDLPSIGRRCFIVTDPRGLGVGTVSAWYNHDFRGEDRGRVHWLCVRPSCQGLGLGKAALAYAMHTLARWHEACYLVTSTERVPAICLYLQFGFVPDLHAAHAWDVWGELQARIHHPRLARALAESG